jgi:hypothetical protein
VIFQVTRNPDKLEITAYEKRANKIITPTEIINDKTGRPLIAYDEVLERWREYFEELLNPVEKTQADNTLAASIHNTEPDILAPEVEKIV